MKPHDPQTVLVDELGLYYLSGEVDVHDHADLLARADASATNIMARLSADEARGAAALLRAAAEDPGHALVRKIERVSQFPWYDDAATWAAFQLLAGRVADRLDALRLVARSKPI